jgi:hypothetical protein
MSAPHTKIIQELQSACQAQGDVPIVRGRAVIGRLLSEEGIEVIEKLAYANLSLDDDWEYRRLGEIFASLHQDEALQRLISFGLQSKNPEVVEAATDMGKDPEHFRFPA